MTEQRRDGAPHEHIVLPARPADAIDLDCGHWTDRAAAVTFSTGRKLYICDHGCGLQGIRKRVAE